MPEQIAEATVVPLEESFLLVGGWAYTAISDYVDMTSIYRYEKLNDSWTLLETRLPVPLVEPVAMMVDLDIFPPCPDADDNSTQ